MSEKPKTVELSPMQVQQLAHDAAIVAAFAKLYAPMAQRRVWNAATRILRVMKLEATK